MFDRLIGMYMVEKGKIDKNKLTQIFHEQETKRAKLGIIAVAEKLMTIAQAEQINMLQATNDKRFGDLAIERGYLTDTQVGRLLELQGNEYLIFAQTLVDMGIMTLEQINQTEEEYQREYGFTESDMAILKSGDVEKIATVFAETDNTVYRAMFSMGIKNIYRLVDHHVFVGKAYKVSNLKDEVLGYQKFHGDQNCTVAIAGKFEDVKKMAIAYTKEEFIDTEEDALDAVCELINCINGLYATELSRKDISVELEPPNFHVTYSESTGSDMMVMPVYICGGQVKYLIAISSDFVCK